MTTGFPLPEQWRFLGRTAARGRACRGPGATVLKKAWRDMSLRRKLTGSAGALGDSRQKATLPPRPSADAVRNWLKLYRLRWALSRAKVPVAGPAAAAVPECRAGNKYE